MSIDNISNQKSPQSVSRAISNAVKCKCPRCGQGRLFNGFIKVEDECAHCGQELYHHRADDLPAYLNIFLVGHIVVGLLLISTKYELFAMWPTTIGGSVLALILSLALMRPIKAMVVGMQWALGMHGFGTDES